MSEDAGQQSEVSHVRPGTLWAEARSAHARALRSGAVKPIAAVPETVIDGGIFFTVWRLVNPDAPLPADRALPRKPAWSGTDANPFLPYDPAMFVAGISESHVCLLNKYNVLDLHLLLVTRAFEHQTEWLTLEDFEALSFCLAEFDGLAFYNAGREAGASQRHKHLQYVPLPLAPGGSSLPIASAVAHATWEDGIGTADPLPYLHALGRLDSSGAGTGPRAQQMLRTYGELLSATGIPLGSSPRQTRPYNLLATRDWMMVLPRRRESWAGVSVNALGFAGSLLVRDDAQMRLIRETGPLKVLALVGVARDTPNPA